MFITNGEQVIEGTGACSYSDWTFKKGDTKFVISNDMGACGPGTEKVPANAKGSLSVFVKDVQKAKLWCN